MAVLKNNLKFLLFMAVIFLAACSELGIPSISDPEEGLTRVAEAVEAQLSSAAEDPAVEEEGAIVAEGSAAGEAVDDTSSETAQVEEQSTATEEPQPTATFTPAPSDTPELEPTATQVLEPTPLPVSIQSGSAEMVLSGGEFEMGANASDLFAVCNVLSEGCEESWFTSSEPIHPVQVDHFYIDTYEVTNEAYIAFLTELGTHLGTCADEDCLDISFSQITSTEDGVFTVEEEFAQHPVAGVNWFGANDYCEWRGGRLPTEAEWEIAASWDPESGEKTLFPWGNEFDETAVNFCDVNCTEQQAASEYDDGATMTAPVGSYENGRSPAGAYDMGGNVWEWVSDWHSNDYYSLSPESNPQGPETGEGKIVRGGSWFDLGVFSSSAVRFPAPPTEAGDSIGFRCALDIITGEQILAQAPEAEEATAEPEAVETVETATEEPQATDTTEPTATATIEPTATSTEEPTATATIEPTATTTIEPTATATIEPTATATLEPTATATLEPTATATATLEPTATATLEPTATATIKPTSEPTAVAKGTATKAAPIAINCNLNPGIDRGSTYVVGLCDWLAKIATKLGVSYQALLAANPQIEDPNLIYPGQVLNVPPRSGPGQSAPPASRPDNQGSGSGSYWTTPGGDFWPRP